MSEPRPRVSIVIPNYNNGRQSSRSGQLDLIGNLLQSLWDTLHDDPTPFELLVHDDGSTDDSIETLRAWATRQWPNGQPFMTLVESPHEGCLAPAANRMYRRARGDIFVRLDGDIACLTRHWVSIITKVFDESPPRLGMVGPKQLGPDYRIHALGDWLLHPNGYTHVAAGLDRYAVRHPIEVDHNMGCFYCCRRAVFEDIDGYDEKCLRGETEDFTLRARLKGWTCIAIPHVEFVHYHGMRHRRASRYDQIAAVQEDLAYFERKWGFSRLAPDLDVVRQRYAGTPLVWNARFLAMPEPADPPAPATLHPGETDWGRYRDDAAFRQKVELRVSAAMQTMQQMNPTPQRVVQIGSGVGLVAHRLAMQGVTVTGIERCRASVELAEKSVAGQTYATGRPRFVHQAQPRELPLGDGEADLALIYDVLERHPNPVGLLKEVCRILGPDRPVVIVTPARTPHEEPATWPEHRYSDQQLRLQLQWGLGFTLASGPQLVGQDLVVVARTPAESTLATEAAATAAAS